MLEIVFYLLGVIGLGALVVFFIIGTSQGQRDRERWLREAHDNYQNALVALKSNPINPALYEQALTLGRAYANLTREQKGVTIYDEMAVMNDLNAATAGAVASPAQASVGSVEERLAKLDDLRARSIISDVEFAHRRQKILDEI